MQCVRIGINVDCLDYSGTNIVVILLETAVFLAPLLQIRFKQYNHDTRAGTIQTVYFYPLNELNSPNCSILFSMVFSIVLENSSFELESSLIQLQSSANELVCSLIVHI